MPPPHANKKKGDDFRDKIKSLCLAASYRPVTEVMISGKKSDVVYEIHRSPRKVKVAIEAKSYNGNLPKSMVSELIGDYLPALQKREVDEVWVVAELDFSSEARKGIDNQPGMFALTYGEFLRTLINFPRYLEQMIIDIENDGIEDYYVEQNFRSGELASQDLVNYASTGKRPLAILSSYGMGKTSLAKIISLRLARLSRDNPIAPIPVLIRLGDLSSQQEMEGLLGSLFTSKNCVEGYSFALFKKLNDLGHLILIFDGLDEMRHAMSWDDFQYNFRQISKILNVDSSAILLGRPNTFKSEQEYRSVLKGEKEIAGQIFQPADAIVFDVKELTLFDGQQLKMFLMRYMTWVTSRQSAPPTSQTIDQRVIDITSMDFDDLISRPVHAQMLASIATDFSRQLSTLSRFGLYKEFVTSTLVRDFDRTGGKSFRTDDRRTFLHKLAHWLWFDSTSDTFRPSNVNLSWLRDRNREQDEEGIRRELISGALLETKLADHFYFSHRSFHEFLVAEFIVTNSATPPRLVGPGGSMTDEIAEFVADTDDQVAHLDLFNFYMNSEKLDYGVLALLEKIVPRLQANQKLTADQLDSSIGWYATGRRKVRLFADTKPEIVFDHFSKVSSLKENRELHNVMYPLLLTSWVNFYNSRMHTDVTDFLRSVVIEIVRNLPLKRMAQQIKESSYILYAPRTNPEIVIFNTTCKIMRNPDDNLVVEFQSEKLIDALVQEPVAPRLMSMIALWQGKVVVPFDEIGPQQSSDMTALRQIYARTSGDIRFVQVKENEKIGNKQQSTGRKYLGKTI